MTARTDLTEPIREKLRAPFERIGKLPKIPKSEQDKPKQTCQVCGGWHQPIHPNLHVDYVGHAAVTDRLNSVVGPGNWSYTIDRWIERGDHLAAVVGTMTICGRTIGQETGTPQKPGPWGDEAKTAISDFICRAAMRFGVAIDLWSKQELDAEPSGAAGRSETPPGDRPQQVPEGEAGTGRGPAPGGTNGSPGEALPSPGESLAGTAAFARLGLTLDGASEVLANGRPKLRYTPDELADMTGAGLDRLLRICETRLAARDGDVSGLAGADRPAAEVGS